MQVLRGDVDAHQVALVPDVIGIDIEEAATVDLDGQVVVVALVEDEIDLSVQFALFQVIFQFHLVERNFGHDGRARLEFIRTGEFLAEQFDGLAVNDCSLHGIAGPLLAHDLDVIRIDVQADGAADRIRVIVLDHQFVTLVRIDEHLVMHTLEGAGGNGGRKLGLGLFGRKIDVLRTDDDVHRILLAEAFVHTVELVADETDLAVAHHGAVEDVALADEVCDEGVDRLVVDVHRSADLLDAALVEDDDGIGKGQGLFLVMGDVDEGDAEFLVHLLELDLHVLAHLQVQGGQRFVQEEDFRLVDDGPGDGDTLLLAAGEGLHVAVLIIGHGHELEHAADALVDLVGRYFLELQAEGDVVIDVQVREQGVTLENGVKWTLVRRNAGEFFPIHHDGSFIRLQESGDHAEQGGFATAGRSQQGQEFAAADIEVNIFEHLFFAEGLGKVLDIDNLINHLFTDRDVQVIQRSDGQGNLVPVMTPSSRGMQAEGIIVFQREPESAHADDQVLVAGLGI